MSILTEGTEPKHYGNVHAKIKYKEPNSNKWELVEENIMTASNMRGNKFDLFRKKKWNGLYKYKTVRRY
jgi:hypothetical protein